MLNISWEPRIENTLCTELIYKGKRTGIYIRKMESMNSLFLHKYGELCPEVYTVMSEAKQQAVINFYWTVNNHNTKGNN